MDRPATGYAFSQSERGIPARVRIRLSKSTPIFPGWEFGICSFC